VEEVLSAGNISVEMLLQEGGSARKWPNAPAQNPVEGVADRAKFRLLERRINDLERENERLRTLLVEKTTPAPAAYTQPAQVFGSKPADGGIVSDVGFCEWPACPVQMHDVMDTAKLNTTRQWPRAMLILWLMATYGHSVVPELKNMLALQEGLRDRTSGSIKRLIKAMETTNLLKVEVKKFYRHKLAIAKLGLRGCELARSMGWEIVESEWDRLRRLHQADLQQAHAGAVLAFAMNARMHGWMVELVPQVASNAEPDVKLTRGEEVEYVEVELGNEKDRKWRNMADLQGYVALCAANPGARQRLGAEARLAKLRGKATDILSLRAIEEEPETSIWIERW
jgi:hypothetical protein